MCFASLVEKQPEGSVVESLWRLFVIFFQIGLFSIGGGYAIIPLIQEQVVEIHEWLSQHTFTNIISISQMTPGPLAVNTSTFVGMQIAGIPGAIVATVGSVLSGICIAITLYRVLQKYKRSTYVLEILNGLKAASLGLIVSAAATILLLSFTGTIQLHNITQIDWLSVVVFVAALIILRKWKMNPIHLMIMTGVIGIITGSGGQ